MKTAKKQASKQLRNKGKTSLRSQKMKGPYLRSLLHTPPPPPPPPLAWRKGRQAFLSSSAKACHRRLGVVRNLEFRAAIYSARVRPFDLVQGLDRVIWSLIFPGNKTINNNKCDSRKALEGLHTISEETYLIQFVILKILHVKHCKKLQKFRMPVPFQKLCGPITPEPNTDRHRYF